MELAATVTPLVDEAERRGLSPGIMISHWARGSSVLNRMLVNIGWSAIGAARAMSFQPVWRWPVPCHDRRRECPPHRLGEDFGNRERRVWYWRQK